MAAPALLLSLFLLTLLYMPASPFSAAPPPPSTRASALPSAPLAPFCPGTPLFWAEPCLLHPATGLPPRVPRFQQTFPPAPHVPCLSAASHHALQRPADTLWRNSASPLTEPQRVNRRASPLYTRTPSPWIGTSFVEYISHPGAPATPRSLLLQNISRAPYRAPPCTPGSIR
ncbi:MAG: hypothetical protein ACE5R6_04490 [Candidatus Heimdallarchaeota archaeon]